MTKKAQVAKDRHVGRGGTLQHRTQSAIRGAHGPAASQRSFRRKRGG
ncbi:DUF5302 family protein [Streptomyces sp. NPDC002092]